MDVCSLVLTLSLPRESVSSHFLGVGPIAAMLRRQVGHFRIDWRPSAAVTFKSNEYVIKNCNFC